MLDVWVIARPDEVDTEADVTLEVGQDLQFIFTNEEDADGYKPDQHFDGHGPAVAQSGGPRVQGSRGPVVRWSGGPAAWWSQSPYLCWHFHGHAAENSTVSDEMEAIEVFKQFGADQRSGNVKEMVAARNLA